MVAISRSKKPLDKRARRRPRSIARTRPIANEVRVDVLIARRAVRNRSIQRQLFDVLIGVTVAPEQETKEPFGRWRYANCLPFARNGKVQVWRKVRSHDHC